MTKLNTFYEKLESQNAKRHKIYKKLVRIAEKKFPALQESVGKAYVEDNKTALYNLHLLKEKIIMGGTANRDDLLNAININTHAENYNELVNGVIEQVKTGMLGGEYTSDFLTALTSPKYRIKEIDNLLTKVKNNPPTELSGYPLEKSEDLSSSKTMPSIGIRLSYKDQIRVIIRPSGTEPKLKCYLEVVCRSKNEANLLISQIKAALTKVLI